MLSDDGDEQLYKGVYTVAATHGNPNSVPLHLRRDGYPHVVVSYRCSWRIEVVMVS